MVDFLRNLSDKEKDALNDRLRADFAGGVGDVARAGDTMTGTLTINAGLAVASTASLSQTNQSGSFTTVGQSALGSIASIAEANIYSPNATDNALVLSSSVLAGGATIAPLRVVASLASQAVLQVAGVFISTASINVAANQTSFIVPIYHQSQGVVGYLVAYKGVV